MAALIEMNSNFSSLIYDKTKASFQNFNTVCQNPIRNNSSFFVIPPQNNLGEYDEEIKKLMENIITLNKLGEIVQSVEEADYLVVLNFKSSVSKIIGDNFVDMEISIFKKNHTIASYASVRAISKSDENFFYFPSKPAKSISYLKIKGLEYLIKKSFPKMFTKYLVGENNA